jgi:hypothetical protein
MDGALRKYLESGHTLADAAAYAGIPYEEARKQLSSATDDSDLEAQRLALGVHVADALTTLSSLLQADDEKVRLGAAKTILELQTKHRPKRIQISDETSGDDLWTTAAKRSVDGQRSQARELEQVDGGGPQERPTGPVAAADDSGEATSADHVAEDASLGGGEMPTGLFDFDAENTPAGLQDAEDIRPATDGGALEPGALTASATHDTAHGESDAPHASLFDNP